MFSSFPSSGNAKKSCTLNPHHLFLFFFFLAHTSIGTLNWIQERTKRKKKKTGKHIYIDREREERVKKESINFTRRETKRVPIQASFNVTSSTFFSSVLWVRITTPMCVPLKCIHFTLLFSFHGSFLHSVFFSSFLLLFHSKSSVSVSFRSSIQFRICSYTALGSFPRRTFTSSLFVSVVKLIAFLFSCSSFFVSQHFLYQKFFVSNFLYPVLLQKFCILLNIFTLTIGIREQRTHHALHFSFFYSVFLFPFSHFFVFFSFLFFGSFASYSSIQNSIFLLLSASPLRPFYSSAFLHLL